MENYKLHVLKEQIEGDWDTCAYREKQHMAISI